MKKLAVLLLVQYAFLPLSFAADGTSALQGLVQALRSQKSVGDCKIVGMGHPAGGIAVRLQKGGKTQTLLINDPATSPESRIVFDGKTYDAMDSDAIGWSHEIFQVDGNGTIVSITLSETINGTETPVSAPEVICQ